jgi:sugar O-acyltransferase (sialic acid O-acetyltransferase NeuD family)
VRLGIFGTGGMGRELADIVRRHPGLGERYAAIVFVSDRQTGVMDGIEILSPDRLDPADEICFALGNSADRESLATTFAAQPLAKILSSTALVSPSARIGEGSIVCDYAVVNSSATVGRHYLGNVYSQVSHDCIIGDYVTLSPHVSCNGWVQMEDHVFIGAVAVIRNGSPNRRLRIGAGAVIGMGAVVTGDVAAGAVVLGVPAKSRT